MTSLYPGLLFYSSGLNKKFTTVGPEATPSEIERKLGRVPFNGRPWPKSSPVSNVYDVRNSSTRMIILNNRLSKRTKGSHLRGQSDYKGEIVTPAPDRHLPDEPTTKWHHHKRCTESVTEKFVPVFPPSVHHVPKWVNTTRRPPVKFDNGSGVNPNHHIHCQGHTDYNILHWYNQQHRPRTQSSHITEDRAMSPIINDPALKRSERKYLDHIARIYSVNSMRVQKQQQYSKLMMNEISKGGYKDCEVAKYDRYLKTPRKTQFGPCDPFRHSRSLPGSRKEKRKDDEETRLNTTQTGRSALSSRGTSSSRPKGKKDVADKKTLQSAGPVRRRSGYGATNKSGDLTGKPARVESPLILKPKKESSMSSLSSLGDDKEEKAEKKSPSSHSSANESDRSSVTGKRDGQKKSDSEAEDGRAAVKIQVNEVESNETNEHREEDDDERSKMSARDTARSNEQRGATVDYHTTYGERETEERSSEENNQIESSKKENYRKASVESQKSSPKEQKGEKKEVKKEEKHANGEAEVKAESPRKTSLNNTERENSDDDYSDEEESNRSKNKVDETTDQQRGDHSDVHGSPHDRAQEKDTSVSAKVKDNGRAEETSSGGNDSDTKLPLGKEEGMSELSSPKTTDGNKPKDTNAQPSTPTVSSSQEKPSDISTIEY